MDEYLDWELCIDDLLDSNTVLPQEQLSTSSAAPSASDDGDDISISVSTIFYPKSECITVEPDSVVASCDGVIFYFNARRLSDAGALNFPSTPIREAWYTMPGSVAQVPETAAILTVILCAVYGISSDNTDPTTEDICAALDQMPNHGLDTSVLVRKGTQLHTQIMTRHAPFRPLLVFSTAACHGMESLAQETSSHLLGLELVEIDDASALKMGARYLRRLILLNVNRVAELKRICGDVSPGVHPLQRRTRGCSQLAQTAMNADCGFVMKKLLWDAKSGMSPSVIRENCQQAAEELTCSQCRECWNKCLDSVATRWAQVKFTI